MDPDFARLDGAAETVLHRLVSKLREADRSEHDAETKCEILNEAREDIKSAGEYLDRMRRRVESFAYHQRSRYEDAATARIQALRIRLDRLRGALYRNTSALEPGPDIMGDARERRIELNEISAVQRDTRASLGRTLGYIEGMKRDGSEAMQQLELQTEALDRAQRDVDETMEMNGRARRVITWIGLRVWRDRLTQYAIIAVEIAIIVFIVLIKFRIR